MVYVYLFTKDGHINNNNVFCEAQTLNNLLTLPNLVPPSSSSTAGQQVKNTTTAMTKDEGGGWVTSSDLTYKAGRSSQVREVSVRCDARHHESVGVITHSRNITVLSE